MKAAALTHLVPWLIAHGYALFFVAAFFDGPIVTTAAGAASALGLFNIWIIVALAIAGDLAADTCWYLLGYYGRSAFVDNYGHYVGLAPSRVLTIERVLKNHPIKTIVFVKISPIIPVPGIITIGMVKVPYRRFMILSALVTIPKSFMFAMIGFYSGKAYEHFTGLVGKAGYVFLGIAVIVLIIYVTYRRTTKVITQDSGLV